MTKTVFITGGASGIGASCVRKFLAQGWNVGFMDLDTALGGELVASIDDKQRVLFIPGDTTVKGDISAALKATATRFGSIDSLVANAGIHRSNTLLDISDEELQRMIDVNIYGNVNTLRLGVPYLIEAGGGSVVINASDQCFVGKPHSFGYGLTKGALGQITRSLAIDLAPNNIRVNAICAGTIRTPLVDNIFNRLSQEQQRPASEFWAEEDALFPLGRTGTPEEAASAIYFLASDASSFCTGAHLAVDGGLTAQ